MDINAALSGFGFGDVQGQKNANAQDSAFGVFAYKSDEKFSDLLESKKDTHAPSYKSDASKESYSDRNTESTVAHNDDVKEHKKLDENKGNDKDTPTLHLTEENREELTEKLEELLADNKNLDAQTKEALQSIVTKLQTEPAPIFNQMELGAILENQEIGMAFAGALDLSDEKTLNALIKTFGNQIRFSSTDLAPETVTATREVFRDFMEHLLQSIPAEDRPELVDIPRGLIGSTLKDLNFNPASDQNIPGLIATDLSPEQLNSLLESIQESIEAGSPVVVGLVKISGQSENNVLLPRGILMPHEQALANFTKNNMAQHAKGLISAESNANTNAELAAKLNSLVTGAGQAAENSRNTPSPLQTQGAKGDNNGDGLQDMMKLFAPSSANKGQAAGVNKGLENAIASANQTKGAPHANPTGNAATGSQPYVHLIGPQSGDVNFSSLMTGAVFPEGLEFLGASSVAGHGFGINGATQATSLVTQAAQASQGHPATQMVAATLSKAASNGETKSITLRLNPPELGRVEIKMQFNKDTNRMQAHMLVEKPETYMMMQRDSHMLEKALQDSGVDTSSGDLSFELAEDGMFFEQDPNGNGSGGRSGPGSTNTAGAEGEDQDSIIDVSVNWHIDPQTGMTRYDILA